MSLIENLRYVIGFFNVKFQGTYHRRGIGQWRFNVQDQPEVTDGLGRSGSKSRQAGVFLLPVGEIMHQ